MGNQHLESMERGAEALATVSWTTNGRDMKKIILKWIGCVDISMYIKHRHGTCVYVYYAYNYGVPESLKTNWLCPHFKMTHNLDAQVELEMFGDTCTAQG